MDITSVIWKKKSQQNEQHICRVPTYNGAKIATLNACSHFTKCKSPHFVCCSLLLLLLYKCLRDDCMRRHNSVSMQTFTNYKIYDYLFIIIIIIIIFLAFNNLLISCKISNTIRISHITKKNCV